MLQEHVCRALPARVSAAVPPDGQQPTVLPPTPHVAAGQQPSDRVLPEAETPL